MVDAEVLAALDTSEKTLREAAAKPGCGVCKTLVAQEADNIHGLRDLMVTTSRIAESQVMLQNGNAKAGAMLATVAPETAGQPLVREYVEERVHVGPQGETHAEVVRGVETTPVKVQSFRERWRIIPEGGLGLRGMMKDRPRLGSVVGGK